VHAIPFVKPGVDIQRVVSGTAPATISAVAETIKTQTPHIDVQVEESGRNTFTVTLVQR